MQVGANRLQVYCSLLVLWEDQAASVMADAFQGQTLFIRAKVVNKNSMR